MTPQLFKKKIWSYYRKNRRSFPWREDLTPYNILVSEIMLQQTQAPRVVSKFESFIKKFPDFKSLKSASNAEVLKEWQGLGYNRRGLNLKRLAEEIITKHNGHIPKNHDELIELPGIGPGTVGSLLAFVHNIPHPFIETNIRTVYIHFFFNDKKDIPDNKILPLIKQTLHKKNPREWYYALMDYGVILKKQFKNPNRNSKHYKKQTSFNGSTRELRSIILKTILNETKTKPKEIIELIKKSKHPLFSHTLVNKIISDLEKEGFIKKIKGVLRINE